VIPILEPMAAALDLTEPCASDAWLCETTLDLTGNQAWANVSNLLVTKGLAVLGILALGLVARWILHRLIGRLVKRAENGVLPDRVAKAPMGRSAEGTAAALDPVGATRRVQRAQAMGSLLKSIVTGLVGVITVIMVLSEIGVDIAPLIASAGIVGLALGFGAQTLVKDFISGVFMIFEDQYGVGDVVDLGEAVGIVEAVSLRVTRLRAVDGTVWYVRNGEISRVGNQSQNWARAVLDISVAYHEDLARVRGILTDVAHDLWTDEEFQGTVVEEPEVWGVEDLAADGVAVRVVLKTAPLEQWRVARVMRERIKARFDHEGIEIPFPQRVVWHREDASSEDDAPARQQAGA
jgi:small-conductance mechanosensitive channel